MNSSFNAQAALSQLAALGYKPGDTVRLRAFLPTKGTDKGRSCSFTMPKIPAAQVEKWQEEGRGIYFVVNPGGTFDRDITQGIAIFFEHDTVDLAGLTRLQGMFPDAAFEQKPTPEDKPDQWFVPKDAQTQLWAVLELPTPTLQIDTGGKSIHTYWRLDQPLPPKEWKLLQSDLLEFSDGDRKIKNPSRVMRLAGAIHATSQQPATILSHSGIGYMPDALRAIIPIATPPEVDRPTTWADFDRDTQIPVAESVPLEVVISKKHRDAITQGSGEGSRNATGYSLACDLIGASNYLASIGQRFEGDPYALFTTYCQACHLEGFPPAEWEAIWKSATGDNPGPALPPASIEMCVKGWLWRENRGNTPPRVTAQSGPVRDPSDVLKASQGKGSEIPVRTSEDLGIVEEFITDPEWSRFREAQQRTEAFNPFVVLPQRLSQIAMEDAKTKSVDPLMLWAYLLPSVSILMGKETCINTGDWWAPNILWSMVIADSGAGKSRARNLVTGVLRNWDETEADNYEERLKDWEARCKAAQKDKGDGELPPKPTKREYYLEIATPEGVSKAVARQEDNGILWDPDELKGLINSLDQYKGGKSGSIDVLASGWNGAGTKVTRADEEKNYQTKGGRLSIVGGIVPDDFRATFNQADPQGILGRFMPVLCEKLPYRRNRSPVHLPGELGTLYKFVRDSEWGTLTLTPEADDRWTAISEHLANEKAPTPNAQPWASKLPEQVLRMAMVIHAIECHYGPGRALTQIGKDTLERAYWLALEYQKHFYHLMGIGQSDDLSAAMIAIQDQACEDCDGGLNARTIVRSRTNSILERIVKSEKQWKTTTELCKALFERLEEAGWGYISRTQSSNGRTVIKYHAYPSKCQKSQETVKNLDTLTHHPEPLGAPSVEYVRDTSDQDRLGHDQGQDQQPEGGGTQREDQSLNDDQSVDISTRGVVDNVNMNGYIAPAGITAADLEALGLEDF